MKSKIEEKTHLNIFLKGTLILVASAFVGECIEFLINLVLAKELGEYGLGQYMSILPIIGLTMIIASLELPVSISKFVAEKKPKYHLAMLRYVTRFVLLLVSGLVLLFVILFSLIPLFADIHPYIRWSIVILIPIIALSSIARGYFMGIQRMGKIAAANLFRRVIQLFLLVVIFQLFKFNLNVSILIALCSFIIGELIVLVYLVSAYYWHYRKLKVFKNKIELPAKEISKYLMDVSLPTTGIRLFNSFTNAIEPFLIKKALVVSGLPLGVATEHFGMVAGVALPIGFFAAFIAHSLMIALIPAVSQAYSERNQMKLLNLLQQVILWTFLYGIPVCAIMIIFAEPLTALFVPAKEAAIFLKHLWPFFLFHYFIIPLQAFLIGLGLVKEAFYQNVWSTFFSYIVMLLLGTHGQFQMFGIIIGMNMGGMVQLLMNYLTVCKKLGASVTLLRKGRILK